MKETARMDKEHDLVVIGTGPGGEGAAMQAAKQGKSVATVERMPQIGGACTHLGTIPSKSLRHAIFQMTEANNNPLFRSAGLAVNLEFRDLRKAAKSVIDRQVEMRRGFYDRNDIPAVFGRARFVDPHVIEVEDDGGQRQRLRAKAFVIATGSRPYRPQDIDFDHP